MTNLGVMEQTKSVPAAGTVEFLHIRNQASSATKYRGVDINPVSNLGNVTVAITAVDLAGGKFATSDGGTSPPYADRSYSISPQNNGPATVKLWALDGERNGIAVSDLAPYRYNSGWSQLTSVTSGSGGAYVWAQGDTAGFSTFLLGDKNNAPTGAPQITNGPVYGLSLSASPLGRTAEPGSSASYEVEISNSGNVSDSYTISTSGSWTASVSSNNLTLDAGRKGTIQVTVDVPAGAANGDSDVTGITAVSQGDPLKSGSINLTTTAGDVTWLYLPLVLRP